MSEDSFQTGPDSPFLLERLMRLILIEDPEADFADEQEFRGAMADRIAAGMPDRYRRIMQDDPRELAQGLAFQAFECDDEAEARELAGKAVEVDPGCVDALTLVAFLESEDAGELLDGLEKIAATGSERLGEDFFEDAGGEFLKLVPARPYLRCLKQIAEVQWSVGRRFDAVSGYEDLAELDPLDHLGNAPILIGYYLAMGEVQRSWNRLEEVDDDQGAVFAWAWVLIHLLVGDEEEATEALDRAMADSPYAAPLLIGLGDEETPEIGPVIVPGSEQEAHHCAQILGEAWERAGQAQWWLYQVLVDLGLIVVEDDGSDGVEGT